MYKNPKFTENNILYYNVPNKRGCNSREGSSCRGQNNNRVVPNKRGSNTGGPGKGVVRGYRVPEYTRTSSNKLEFTRIHSNTLEYVRIYSSILEFIRIFSNFRTKFYIFCTTFR